MHDTRDLTWGGVQRERLHGGGRRAAGDDRFLYDNECLWHAGPGAGRAGAGASGGQDKKARHSRPLPYKGRGAAESWGSGRAQGASSSTARQRKPHRVHISAALDAGGGRRGLAAQPGPTGGAGGAQVAARTTGGGAMIRSTAAAALLLLLCGLALSAPAGARADPPPEASEDAAHAAEELRGGAAELAAVPPESRALFAQVLGRLDGLRGEVDGLKADKRRSDERIARLEESDCECGEGVRLGCMLPP